MRQSAATRLGVAALLAGGLVAATAPAVLAQAPPLPATLTAELGEARLFEEAAVTGRLDPPHPGASVDVELLLEQKAVARESVPLAGDGSAFETELPVEEWGTFTARVTFPGDSDHPATEVTTQPSSVRAPGPLRSGANSDEVLALENRLEALGYRLPKPNRNFDKRTADAVLAFHKVNGMGRVSTVSMGTWKRLTDPRMPKPRAKRPNVHIEVDQTKQVLYVVRGGEIEEIVHVSTGAGGATRDGVFNVHRKIAGYSPNRLYYPSYFDGLRAVHGWPEVPPSPASAGCVRVPYWTAKYLFRLMNYGMQVRVYH